MYGVKGKPYSGRVYACTMYFVFLCKLYLFSACGHMNEESFPIGAYGKWQLGINLIWTKECFCLPNSETKFGKTRNPPF